MALFFVAVVGVWKSAGRTTSLPIFETSTASAAEVAKLPQDVRERVNAGTYYPFASSNGRAYVASSRDGARICLIVPDYIPDSYGTSCRRRDEVERSGLVVAMQVDKADAHRGLAALLLPADTESATFVSTSGNRTQLHAAEQHGVITFPINADGVLEWVTPAGSRRQELSRSLPEGPTITSCADGKPFEIPAGVSPEQACDGKGGWEAP